MLQIDDAPNYNKETAQRIHSMLMKYVSESIRKSTLSRLPVSPDKTAKNPNGPLVKKGPVVTIAAPPLMRPRLDSGAPPLKSMRLDSPTKTPTPIVEIETPEFHYWAKWVDHVWGLPGHAINSWKTAYERYTNNCAMITDCPAAVSRAKCDEWR